tara:strand:+ start:485 stop:649 length:165 start_codon:yes stop_codon:yes gene_type:complete
MDISQIKPYMFDRTRTCRLNPEFDDEFMAFIKKRGSNINREIKAAITAHMEAHA